MTPFLLTNLIKLLSVYVTGVPFAACSPANFRNYEIGLDNLILHHILFG